MKMEIDELVLYKSFQYPNATYLLLSNESYDSLREKRPYWWKITKTTSKFYGLKVIVLPHVNGQFVEVGEGR